MFTSKPCRGSEEALASIVGFVAFDGSEFLLMLGAGLVASLRHPRFLFGRVLDREHGQSGPADQAFVLTCGHKESEANRGSNCYLIAADRAGQNEWIGEDNPSTRCQQTRPVGEHAGAVGQVVDRIDADNGIERRVAKREGLARVGLDEAGGHSPTQIRPGGASRGDRFPIQVDSGDCAACSKSEMQGRAARTTRHIQKPGRAMQFKPRRKAFKLVDCQPTVLTDVLPKSRTPNTCVDLCRELSVLATVMTRNLRLISDRPSLRRISQTARRQDTNVGHGSGMTGDTAYSGDRRRL